MVISSAADTISSTTMYQLLAARQYRATVMTPELAMKQTTKSEAAVGDVRLSCVRSHRSDHRLNALGSLHLHWPEYLMEAGELGLYLIAACAVTTLLQHPASPIRHFVQSEIARRALMGLAMGATVIGIVISPWGRQSGGHFNP